MKRTIITNPAIHHRMISHGPYLDTRTGEEWDDLLDCPECGYQRKIQWQPFRAKTVRLGEGMITPEDAERIIQLCEEGPAGEQEAREMLRRGPAHTYLRVPSEDDLRSLAKIHDKLAEFEEAVDEAIVNNEPLLRFGLGDETAEVWPKGCRPSSRKKVAGQS